MLLAQPERVRLWCAVDGVGTASLVASAPEESAREEELRLVLQGAGSLAGRVVAPEGVPIAGRSLIARLEGSSVGWARPYPEDKSNFDPSAASPGLSWQACALDAAGRFAFAGLRPGRYEFALMSRTMLDEVVHPIPRSPVATDRLDLELHAHVPRLVVRVVDAQGRAVDVGAVGIFDDLEPDGAPSVEPLLRVIPCTPEGELDPRQQPIPLPPQPLSPGAYAWELFAGGDVLISLTGAQHRAQALHLHVPWEQTEFAHSFVLEAAEASARLHLDVRASDAPTSSRVMLTELDSGARVRRIASWSSEFSPLALHPGRYRLDVDTWATGYHGPYESHVPYAAEFELLPHEQQQLEVVLEPKAELALFLRTPQRKPRRGFDLGARVELLPLAGGEPLRANFWRAHSQLESDDDPVRNDAWRLLPLDTWAKVEDVLAAGPWRVRVELPGREPLERIVELRAGERAQLEFDLPD